MVLLYSERNAPKARQTNRRLANQLVATLPRMASHKRCDLDLYFKQRGLHKHLKRRLWNVLHYYVTPNSTDSEIRSILAEISDAHFYPAQLWAWIGTWEEPCAKIAKLVESRSIVQLGDHLRTAPQYVWGFIEHQKYFNIAHASVAADMLDVTMLLCRSTDPRARVGLNQSNFYDETPAHMAAGLLKTTHLRQLVNCEWVDLLVPDGLGRSPIHTLLSVLLRPSARIGKSMVEITAIVSDALSRCHMLAALRDHSGWTLADYALSLGGAGLLAVAVQPVLSVDSVFSSRTELNLFCVTLLKHAILKDDPGLVTYTQSLFQRFVVGGGGSAQGGDASIYALIDIVQFAVQSGRTKALHCICSDKETSLHLRQLGLLGWTPVPAALSPQGSTPGVLTALMRYFPGDNGWGNYHSSKPPIGAQSVDNMFSMAAFFGDVDAMRALLMAAGPAKIVLRRQAADDSPSYYFNRHVYRWSPIVAAVLGRSCDGEAAMRALLYVLQLTPFADLINAPQALSPGDGELGESCVTNALAEACRRMDLPVVRELCIHGADPLFSIPQPGPRQGDREALDSVRRDLADIDALQTAINGEGLSARATGRAAALAAEEETILSKLAEEARCFLATLNAEDLEAVTNLPEGQFRLLVLAARVCWGDASEGALAERVQARPAALVRAAADCIRAASMPHVYPAEAVYRHAALRDRLMKHDDDSRQLRDEKLRLLADDRLQAISECADYVNSRLSSVLRAEDPVSAKRGRRRQGAPAVLRIMCRWALSLSKSVALVVSNARASYVATAGVMQLLLSRLQRRVSTILDTVLLPPRTLSAVHFLSAPPQCSRRMKPNVPREMLLVLLDQINRKYNVQSSASSSGREGYIDIRTQPHLLCLQSSRRSALDSCLWDMMGAADEGLALSGLRACRQQIGESLRVRHRQLSVFEDAFGLEGLAAHRYRVATSLEDNHVILEDLLRESIVLGRSHIVQLLTSAVQQLDTHAVLLVLLNSLIDCSGAFPVSLWDTLLEEIPTRFSHLQFGPLFERGKGRSGALFTGVDRSAHCLPGSESLETRACVMREVLTMCRGASPRIGDSCPAITPRSCEGSLCCEISSGAAPDALYDTQYWSSMDAYELTSHYWVSYVLDTVGSSALGGLILLVRQRDIESPGGITEPPPASRAGSTPQPFSLASVSKVLSVSGEWMDPRHLYSKPRGTWCSNYEQTENRPRPIQLVDASDRFLCMPSGVIDPKLVALRSKLGWIKASLHSNSVSCNRSIDRVLRANSGGCLAAVLLEDGKGLDRTDCGLFYAAQCGNYEVVRDLLCSQAIDGNPAVGASLIVWQSLSTATSGDGNVAPDSFPFRALLNARLFLDEIYAEASRRLISAERRYDALLRAAGGACPGRSPKPFLDATLWLLRMAARVTEAGAPIAPFFALLQGAVRRDGRTANVGTFRSDCAFILRVLYLNGVMDDASFRSFSESLESTPLEHVRFLLDTVCSYPDCGPNAATVDGVLHTVWMASDRSRDAVRAPLVAFAVAEEAALGLSPDAVSPAWLQWASALLHLCSERSSVETGHAVLRQLVEIGLLAAPAVSARRADEHSPLSADTSDSDASEGVDSEAASEAECGQWYHQASNIVCEVVRATRSYTHTLMLIRQAQANISTIRYYERTDLLSTFSRRLDVFGVPYGHVESGPAPDSRWQVSADDSDLVSIPLGSMPLLCLDGGEVAAVLLGAMTPINVGRKRGVRDGLPSALLERLFGLSMAALRGLHPHELLFRLYRLLDVQSDECAVNKGISEDMICSLDQLRSLLSAHGEDASGGGMSSDALMARLTMVAKHVSVFASSCINHIRGAQFRHIDRCALLWSIRQQQLFHDVSGKIPVLSADNRIIDASSEETSVQSMLDLVLSAVRSGSAAGLSVVLKMLPGHPGTLVPRESLLKQPDDDEWPILPCVASISSTAFGRANAKLIWRIWCAAAAAPNIEIIKVLIAAGWEMGYLYDSERADETSVSDVSASGMASEGRDPALRRAVALLEYGGTSLDWSVLHSAYCGVEKASQAIDATRIISLLSSERRIVSRQHARHRARELLSSMSLINSPAMWLWHFTCPVSGGAESSEEAVFDIAAALGDWAVIKDIMSADSFIAILHYCTRFRRCDRLSSTDCRSPLMHYAMLDQRADIIVLAAMHQMLLSTRIVVIQHSQKSFENNNLFPDICRLPEQNVRTRFTQSLLHDAVWTGNESVAVALLRLTARVHTAISAGGGGCAARQTPIVYHDAGLYAYAINAGMLQLVSMMNTWPFAVSSEWQAMPRPLVSRYSLGRLGSFAFAGRVALLRQELDQTAFLNEDWTQVLNSFRWAVCGRQDRCAVIALRALIYHSVTNSRAFDLIDSELTLLNQSNELLRHLACHGLSRTLQFLLLSKSTFVKSLQKHLDEAEVFALFELSTMNSCAAGGLAVLRYCSENDIPPPAIIARNMPLITFHDILRVLPRSIVRRGAKRGQLNLYYSTQKVYPRAAGELCSTTRFLLEPSVLVANEQKAVQSIPIILEMGKENAVTISQAQAFEPKARPSVVIIRARGKIAAFRTSNKLTISG